nr:hypothetical protein [Prauserella flavalba]
MPLVQRSAAGGAGLQVGGQALPVGPRQPLGEQRPAEPAPPSARLDAEERQVQVGPVVRVPLCRQLRERHQPSRVREQLRRQLVVGVPHDGLARGQRHPHRHRRTVTCHDQLAVGRRPRNQRREQPFGRPRPRLVLREEPARHGVVLERRDEHPDARTLVDHHAYNVPTREQKSL